MGKKDPTASDARRKKQARRLKALTRALGRLEARLSALEAQGGQLAEDIGRAVDDAAAAREGMRALRDAGVLDPPTHSPVAVPLLPRAAAEQIATAYRNAADDDHADDDDTDGDAATDGAHVADADATHPDEAAPASVPADPPPARWPEFDAMRLAALEGRLQRATPGAWRSVERDGRRQVSREADWAHTVADTPHAADAHLIAHAPDDLAWLTRELRHSWGREAAWRETAHLWRQWHAQHVRGAAPGDRQEDAPVTPSAGSAHGPVRWVLLGALLGVLLALFARRR